MGVSDQCELVRAGKLARLTQRQIISKVQESHGDDKRSNRDSNHESPHRKRVNGKTWRFQSITEKESVLTLAMNRTYTCSS